MTEVRRGLTGGNLVPHLPNDPSPLWAMCGRLRLGKTPFFTSAGLNGADPRHDGIRSLLFLVLNGRAMKDIAAKRINEALAALQRGEDARAEQLLKKLLRKMPRHLDALIILGAVCGRQGRYSEAATLFERAVKNHPDNAEAHYNMGLAVGHLGFHDRALECYQRALAADPRHLNTHNNLAAELLASDRCEEALRHLKQALAYHPDDPQLLGKFGLALKETGCYDDAIAAFRRAIRIVPDDPVSHANLGLVLRHVGRLDEAIDCFRRAIALNPRPAPHHHDLGLTLYESGQSDAAIKCMRQAIALSAEPLEFRAEGVRQAIALDAEPSEFRANLGVVLLAEGKFREGWAEREHRLPLRSPLSDRPWIDAPFWKGEPLAGKSILVHAEQGLGDSLQFVRYLPFLSEMGAAVTFTVQPVLIPLLKHLAGKITLVPTHDAGARFDFQALLLSLPHRFGTDLSNIPNTVPYIAVDGAKIAYWRERIGRWGFKVGISWQGNPKFIGDAGRSIALREFEPLSNMPGVRLISLQKNPGAGQIAAAPFGGRIETPLDPDDIRPEAMVDTAGVMMNCDLVISSCTMNAHLAGALARPLFVALRRVPDWRWLVKREDCPWYPTARLFRQEQEGDWASVCARIAAAVRGAAEQGGMNSVTSADLPDQTACTLSPPHAFP